MQTQKDTSLEGQRTATRPRETRQRWNELPTTLLTVKLRAQERGFLSRTHHQTTYGLPESRNRRLHTKDRAFMCLPPLMSIGGVLQSIPGSFIMRLPYNMLPAYMIPAYMLHAYMLFTRHIRSLIGIISSLATGIKPLLVARSASQNSGMNKPTNSSVERI